jgi:menaquinol-cytochrome c reductase iron-sulfur subunit
VPDRHTETKSKYTADRGIPGAFEGETITRRRLMNLWANGVGGVAAAAFTLPALGFAIAPIFKRQSWEWQPIGRPSDFPASAYMTKVITTADGLGEAGNTIAYVRARNPSIDKEPEDQYNRFVALSSRCMHLGCPVRYVPAAERFICPCHGGVYDFRGMVAGGPPVRPLDRFYTRVNNSTGLVEIGPRYSVNNELRRFAPRFPGEPLDGIGQYLYPAQFDTAQKP